MQEREPSIVFYKILHTHNIILYYIIYTVYYCILARIEEPTLPANIPTNYTNKDNSDDTNNTHNNNDCNNKLTLIKTQTQTLTPTL